MAKNLVSALLKIPRAGPRYHCYLSITRSKEIIGRGQVRSSYIQLEKCCRINVPPFTQIRKFQVSDPKRALHPILILLLRPLSKIFTILFGRLIRRWWRKLSPEEKEKIWNKIRRRQAVIAGAGSVGAIVCMLYYYDHVVETPLTKRNRFIMMSEDVMIKIAQVASEEEIRKYKSDIVPQGHPFYQRTMRVTNAIIRANRDIPEINRIPWSLVVVDRPDVTNAYCLADGKIFVFTGILNLCTNDDQLAIVLSHEMSHTILSHTTENVSNMYFFEALLLIPSLVFWIAFTDVWAIISDLLMSHFANVLIHLPFSRALETEADMVGLFLAARACFDVREALTFWAKIAGMESSASGIEWLSTHPSGKTRYWDINKFLPAALELRSKSNCSILRSIVGRYG